MSKIVLVCLRYPQAGLLAETRERLAKLLSRMRPDNLPEAPISISDDGKGLLIGTLNQLDCRSVQQGGAYVGWLADPGTLAWDCGARVPDGTFALIRHNASELEILADCAASRTIWFAHTPDMFVASTSQRAVPALLGSLELNPEAMGWMISSGSLGPGHSWDRRARALGPGGRVHLDRLGWRTTITEPKIIFQPTVGKEARHGQLLRESLERICGSLNLDWAEWAFLLSGGKDSRAILQRIRGDRVRCVTWGMQSALNTAGTDASVAKELAAFMHLPFEYYGTDPSGEQFDRVFQRFLVAGDGRIDHVGGYMDGLKLWAELARKGVVGVVRGDQPFGREPVSRADDVPVTVGMARWSDFRDFPSAEQLGLHELAGQEIPAALQQNHGEALADWRDRLVHAFKIPTILAALSDIKLAYVEIANPLLTQAIVHLARAQPAHLRTSKKLFRDIAAESNVPIPYATNRSIATTRAALTEPSVREFLLDQLASAGLRAMFPQRFTAFVAQRLTCEGPERRTSSTARRMLSRWVPGKIKAQLLRRRINHAPSASQLAIRACMIFGMAKIMADDAR